MLWKSFNLSFFIVRELQGHSKWELDNLVFFPALDGTVDYMFCTGVAPGIFRMGGLTLLISRLKYGLQGTRTAEIL